MILSVVDTKGVVLAKVEEEQELNLVLNRIYQRGDRIILSDIKAPCYLMMQVDDALGEALIYVTENEIQYTIPFDEKKVCYSPKTFYGTLHVLTARYARQEEIISYRNLALNVMDQHEFKGYYPHASANVETRGESVFAAQNAIDGIKCNTSHGEWPYGSWGINQRKDAAIKIDLGRVVEVDKLILYTRADFPHDSWWIQVTVTFSDGTSIQYPLEKTKEAQVLIVPKRKISWVMLSELIKAEDESPFPALTQIEVYGRA